MRKIITLGIMLLFLGMTISSSVGFNLEKQSTIAILDGNTLYVGGNGTGNYTKIQDAIDNASDGDTVYVYDDSSPYYENVIVNKSINLIGQDKNSTIIDCKRDENVIYVTKDNVKVSDFTIKNMFTGSSFKDGINVRAVKNLKISNCNIVDNQMEGIYVRDSNNITISYNIITSNDHYGINFDDTDDIFIIGNEILNNPSHGICLDYCSNIVIDNNNISSNGAIGILFSSVVTSSKISNNVITNNSADGIFLQSRCYNANITDNIIKNNDEKGILIKDSSHNVTISDNIVMGNNDDYLNTENGGGICIYGSNDNIITRNIVKYNTHEEIYLSGALRTLVTNNEINSGYMENLKIVNCFYSEVSNNNFRIENNNKVIVVYNKWGNLTDFFNTFFRLNTIDFNQNYWNRLRLFPKAIKASYEFKFGLPDHPGFLFKISFLIFDKNPASEPYDIGV